MTSLSVLAVESNAVFDVAFGVSNQAVLPEVVVSRAGCFELANRLVAQGKLEAAAAYMWLLQHARTTANYGGYALPWRSIGEMVGAFMTKGFSLEAMHFLFQASLVDYPQVGCPAVVYSRPGYAGAIREIRSGGKVWSEITACLN